MNDKHTESTWILGLVLLIIAITVGYVSYEQYGIGLDEKTQRQTGLISYDYIFSDSTELLTWKDRDYGVAFELPLIAFERALGLTDVRHIYLARHALTHAFFLVSAFFGFLLIDYIYRSKLLATIGFFFFVLHPRIYAHSFFNTKDVPFMSMFLICFYLCARAFNKKTIFRFVFLGVGIGVLINLRIMGVLMACCVLFFLAIDMVIDKSYRRSIGLLIVFVLSALCILVGTWPFLWSAPFHNFVQAFMNMSKFRWSSTVLFMGQIIKATELDWTYIPVWFCITTPLWYLAIGLFSTLLFAVQVLKNPTTFLSNGLKRNNGLYFVCFFAPVTAVIILHSVLYDGWRQMYFIYPAFVMLLIYGLNEVLTAKKTKYVVAAASVALFTYVCVSMIDYYPFQNVYFNALVDKSEPESVRKQFELDYWGTSYHTAFEYILANDTSPSIRVVISDALGENNISLIPADDRKRIKFGDQSAESDYYITLYKRHAHDYLGLERFKWHAIKRNNSTICQIFKRPNNDQSIFTKPLSK